MGDLRRALHEAGYIDSRRDEERKISEFWYDYVDADFYSPRSEKGMALGKER